MSDLTQEAIDAFNALAPKDWIPPIICVVDGCVRGDYLERVNPKGESPFRGMCREHYREWVSSVWESTWPIPPETFDGII